MKVIPVWPAQLRAVKFSNSGLGERATWLRVLARCVEVENGGRISGCGCWDDRRWQKLCGVTKSDIEAAPLLLRREGEDLIVWGYPAEQGQDPVKRAAGCKGGSARTEAKAKAAQANGRRGGRPCIAKITQAQTQAALHGNPSKNPTEATIDDRLGPTVDLFDFGAAHALPACRASVRTKERWMVKLPFSGEAVDASEMEKYVRACGRRKASSAFKRRMRKTSGRGRLGFPRTGRKTAAQQAELGLELPASCGRPPR